MLLKEKPEAAATFNSCWCFCLHGLCYREDTLVARDPEMGERGWVNQSQWMLQQNALHSLLYAHSELELLRTCKERQISLMWWWCVQPDKFQNAQSKTIWQWTVKDWKCGGLVLVQRCVSSQNGIRMTLKIFKKYLNHVAGRHGPRLPAFSLRWPLLESNIPSLWQPQLNSVGYAKINGEVLITIIVSAVMDKISISSTVSNGERKHMCCAFQSA